MLLVLLALQLSAIDVMVPTESGGQSAFRPDGALFVSYSGRSAKLWDVATGAQLRTFSQPDLIFDAAFSPDGRSLAIASQAGLFLWEVETARTIWRTKDDTHCVVFTEDGSQLYSGCKNDNVELRDAATGAVVRTYPLKTGWTGVAEQRHAIRLLKGNRILVWVPTGLYVIDGASGATRSLSAPCEMPRSFKVLDDGRVVGMCPKARMYTWNVETGAATPASWSVPGLSHEGQFTRDGRFFFGDEGDRVVKVDTASGAIVRRFEDWSWDRVLRLSPDERSLLYGWDQQHRLMDVASGKKTRSFGGERRKMNGSTLSADGRWLLYSAKNRLALWDLQSGTHRSFPHIESSFEHFALSADGRLAAVRAEKAGIQVVDLVAGRVLRTIATPATNVKITPDGRTIIAWAESKPTEVVFFDAATGNKRGVVSGLDTEWNTRIFGLSPDGSLFAAPAKTIVENGTIVATRVKLVHTADLSTEELEVLGSPSSVSFSADSKRMLLGHYSHVSVVDLETKKPLESLSFRHAMGGQGMPSVAFLPGETSVVAAAGADVIVLDLKARTMKELRGHSEEIDRLTCSGTLCATASWDGSARLWNLEQGVEKVALYAVRQDDWVALAPDGHFDASPEGGKAIALVEGVRPIPLDALFERFFERKLVARVLSGEHTMAPPITSLKPPPRVRIVSPAASAKVESQALDVTLEATDEGGGVDELRLALNGKVIDGDARGLKRKEKATTRTVRVVLASGVNVLRATAFNADRTESAPSEITIELTAPQARATLHVIAVGISKYQNPRYTLTYGRADAEAIVAGLKSTAQGVFKEVSAVTIADDQATKERITAALDAVAARAQPQDVLVFFFAGHGVMSEAAPQEFFLVPQDVTRMYGADDVLASRAVSAGQLRDGLAKVKAQKQLVVLDACQAGGAVDSFATRGAAEEKAIYQLGRSAGAMVIAATGTEQAATELKALGHGLFTHALLAGLKGSADGAPKDGKVTVRELDAWLNEQVPLLTERYRGAPQYPQSWARGQDFPLGVCK